MEAVKLKTCPFCEAAPEIKEAPNHNDIIVYWVRCANWQHCKATPSTNCASSPDDAAKIWNKRGEWRP